VAASISDSGVKSTPDPESLADRRRTCLTRCLSGFSGFVWSPTCSLRSTTAAAFGVYRKITTVNIYLISLKMKQTFGGISSIPLCISSSTPSDLVFLLTVDTYIDEDE